MCGLLTWESDLTKLSKASVDLSILSGSEITRKERKSHSESIEELKSPVIDKTCNSICSKCLGLLTKKEIPTNALVNNLWLGQIPPELNDLSWTEQLLIAQVMHNYCIIKVASSGMRKLKTNAVCHAVPISKVYSVLPPKHEDLDEVLACLYIGPSTPTPADYERTPFLVRRNKVASALEWLKLNHWDYADLEISYDNLNEYPKDVPPVVVDYYYAATNKDAESTAVNDCEENEGTEKGSCPFVVHGITGEHLSEHMKQNPKIVQAKALKHFKSGGKVLGVGHSEKPKSLYNNESLYPQMFPWLFLYGMGGTRSGNPQRKK